MTEQEKKFIVLDKILKDNIGINRNDLESNRSRENTRKKVFISYFLRYLYPGKMILFEISDYLNLKSHQTIINQLKKYHYGHYGHYLDYIKYRDHKKLEDAFTEIVEKSRNLN